MPNLHATPLLKFTTRIFNAVGVPESDASIVAKNLIGANLRGHDSHGMLRIPQYVDFLRKGDYQVGVELAIDSESPGVVVTDGQWGLGQVQAHRLLDLVIPRARELGLAAGTGRNFGHIGRLGEYAERAADEGLILIATVNNNGAGQRVAPPGGTEGRIGTNPLCASVPTNSDPVVLDFGTSVAAEGKVRVHYFQDKKPVPEGWLLDAQGHPTTDPSVLYEPPLGTILPMGGTQAYKGFGLGLVLDMLSGGLTGGKSSHSGAAAAKGNNVVFLVLDPEKFAGLEALIGQSSGLASYVRATPRAKGVAAILLPGDPERMTLEYRSVEGIPIDAGLWSKLVELAASLEVKIPEIPQPDPYRDPSKVPNEEDV
ncbi:Ldh family oxidoreductase [Tundrisphaera lichenicola]|uniref:Ldh family oxidoreductase n=1 Tax=Tundrisphaera lichenicola TaxID=2029860 RepID=UPI003EBCF9E0